jgi:hypothetical protein
VKYGIKKPPLPPATGKVQKAPLTDDGIRFSFKHYTVCDKFCMPDLAKSPHYVAVLFDRMKHVSGLKLSEFRLYNKTLRAHSHDWEDTTEKAGYMHLSQQMQECEPWQFSLSANEHGRVHGVLVDNVFYVVWLDPNHALYP